MVVYDSMPEDELAGRVPNNKSPWRITVAFITSPFRLKMPQHLSSRHFVLSDWLVASETEEKAGLMLCPNCNNLSEQVLF